MYGDAFDIKPLATSINSLESVCSNNGGKLVEYNSHVHCDWRFDSQDQKLFGAAALAPGSSPDDFVMAEFSASIERHEGVLTAPAEGFDEGGFTRDPALAVDALTRWEGLVANPGPYAAIAPKQAADVRESYLRLCYDGEQQKPQCKADKALRASYSGFGKAHADSPSAPVVAAFYQALRRRKWQASAEQLDAMVKKALGVGPS